MKQVLLTKALCLVWIVAAMLNTGCNSTENVVSENWIQKRKYRNGWFVASGNSHNQHTKRKNEVIEEIEPVNYSVPDPTAHTALLASVDETPIFIPEEEKKVEIENCDIVFLKTGEEIEAKVIEVNTNDIKYKMCDNPDGPTITKQVSEIFMIKYPNGTKTVFSDDQKDQQNTQGNNKEDQYYEPQPEDTGTTAPHSESSGKSQIVAFLLAIFLGLIGIHRFYLGHIGMGILYLLTAGLCGFGWIVDIILIAVDALKPKDGEYDETL